MLSLMEYTKDLSQTLDTDSLPRTLSAVVVAFDLCDLAAELGHLSIAVRTLVHSNGCILD